MNDAPAIRALARLCAAKGLSLRDSRALLDALWTADAVALHGGKTQAAVASGLQRETLTRLRNRCEAGESAE